MANTEPSGVQLPFEFCALRYLLQWERKESVLYAGIRKPRPTLAELRKALRFFQVSRNFAGVKEDARAERIRDALLMVRADALLDTTERVLKLAESLRADFQYNLSAASKLLWLSDRKNIIYDSRALQALREGFDFRGTRTDYSRYCQVWRKAYDENSMRIEQAIAKLPKARQFLPS
jgi:hypothetical protein